MVHREEERSLRRDSTRDFSMWVCNQRDSLAGDFLEDWGSDVMSEGDSHCDSGASPSERDSISHASRSGVRNSRGGVRSRAGGPPRGGGETAS